MNQVKITCGSGWPLAVKGLALLATLVACSVKTQGLAGTGPDDGGEASGEGGALSPGPGGMRGSGGVPGSGGSMGKGGAGPSGSGGGTGGSPTGAGGGAGSGGAAMGMGGSSMGMGGAVVRLDGGPARDMAPTVDAGRQDGPRDVVSVDSPIPQSSVGVVQCGPAGSCSLGSTVCCASAVPMCRPRATGCSGSLPRQCDGPEDCDGRRICCGRVENHPGVFSASCEDDKECRDSTEAELCHGNADCANGQKCCPIPVSNTTVGACRASCP